MKILDIADNDEKISLSLRALQAKPIKRKEQLPRKSLQDRVDEKDSVGFNSLKEKLGEWIEESGLN